MDTRTMIKTISTKHTVSADMDGFARGLVDYYIPKTYGLYQVYRSYMHDILCLGLISSGYYRDSDLSLEKLSLFVADKKLMSQRPDLYSIEENILQVCEVTFSYNAAHDKQKKMVKYNDLFKFIEESSDLRVSYSVICVDLTDSEWEDSVPSVEDGPLNLLRKFISNLRLIHSSPEFAAYRTQPSGTKLVTDLPFEIDEEHIISIYNEITGESNRYNDFIDSFKGSDDIDDDQYLDTLAMSILESQPAPRPSPHPEAVDISSFVSEWEDFSSRPPNTTKMPRILQLGSPSVFQQLEMPYSEVINTLRETPRFGGYLDLIKTFLSANPGPPENGLITLGLSQSQLEFEQLQGPGRKSLLKRQGINIPRESPTHIGVDPSHEVKLTDLISRIDSFKEIELDELPYPDIKMCGPAMLSAFDKVHRTIMNSPMTAVNLFYQRLSQEITLNSMRRRKSRQYTLGYSGFKNVYFIVAPGPQLRTESNVEFIKVISLIPPLVDKLSAPWHPTGDHWESDWLSVDTDRLKHWMRCSDRIIMSFLACTERLVTPDSSLQSVLKSEIKYGNYQMLALTYLENKSTTSTTNQTIRYLWIKSLGDKMMTGLYKKFPSRVNSVIQSTMLQRSFRSVCEILSTHIGEMIKIGQTFRDEESGLYDETTTGIKGSLPRLITMGDRVPISYNLNEIYWCMMYNKDRQNPTQDSMSILDKILKEEAKFDAELAKREGLARLHYVLGKTSLTEDIAHVRSNKPESHYFSNRAVRIGVELQDKHGDNAAPNGAWLNTTKLDEILNKKLSDFATFKASVKTIVEKVDPNDLDEISRLGSRTKAIELVYELSKNEKLCTSLDVAVSVSGDKNSTFQILIQIFKKNQVGGVREIIILFIKARILFNILEEVARLLSKSDKREILTKGRDKRLMMRGDYEDVMSKFKAGTPIQIIKHSYDMTTWAQHFIPTIFMVIHNHHFKSHPGMLNLSRFLFTKHTDKKMEFPRKLVEQWSKHRTREHEEPWMNAVKQKFLSEGRTFFKNRSNMCQGIPHYNSTVLALSCQSLRDELFERCLRLIGQRQKIVWQTRVGSDDKGDMIAVDMSDKDGYKQYILFEQCALAAERLHSMELSVKSAAGNVVYELNSAFMVNLETLSPTIKFAAASTDMIGTTSCTAFVNESYTRIRQLRENGSSSLICLFAHTFNSMHFDQVFRTGEGMVNDASEILQIPREIVPYDLGHYPMYDCDLQDIVGPEFHNYLSMIDPRQKQEVKQLLFTPLGSSESDELFLPSEDQTTLLKKDHFNISQGMIRQLRAMRERLGLTSEMVKKYFEEHPLLVINGPQNLEEVQYSIASKLFTKGASESLRRTSPAIYFGRLTAFESARAWKLQSKTNDVIFDMSTGKVEDIYEDIDLTYREFLIMGLKQSKELNLPVDDMLSVIYPQRNSFDVIRQFMGKFGLKRTNSKYFSQAVRNWVVNNFNYNFTSGLKDIIQTAFGQSQLASNADVEEFQALLGVKLNSIEDVLSECERSGIRPIDLFFYMNKIFRNVKQSKIQVFASGPSTNSLQRTLISIKKFNHLPNVTMFDQSGINMEAAEASRTLDKTIDELKFCCNLLMMEDQGYITGSQSVLSSVTFSGSTNLLDRTVANIRSIQGIQGFDLTTQKVLLYLISSIMGSKELKETLLKWRCLNYSYLRRQRKVINGSQITWEGDLSLLVSSASDVFTVNMKNGYHYIEALRINDPTSILRDMRTICKMLDFDLSKFFTVVNCERGDFILSEDRRSVIQVQVESNNSTRLNLRYNKKFNHSRLIDYDDFKVIKEINQKDLSVEIYLQTRKERSATICHMVGSCYPVEVPSSTKIGDDLWCRGIRLNRLMANRDWFFNGRLPPMSDKESISFLRKDVNMDVVLSSDSTSRTQIVDYLQVHDEVNEEAFGIMNAEEIFGRTGYNFTLEDFKTGRIMEMFNQEVDKLANESFFLGSYEDIGDWAEEVEKEGEAAMENLKDALGNEEDGIRLVRSLGSRVVKKRRNHMVMTSLQQGALMKKRILDMFFSMSSILSESKQSLPYYCLWVMDQPREDKSSKLMAEILNHIKQQIIISTGSNIEVVDTILARSNRSLKRSIPRLAAYLYNEDEDQDDLYSMMATESQIADRDYAESISNTSSSDS
ncbi:RNA dependent RNA polymerase [Rice Peribunya-like virus 1]|nr:RNA dependent RNA polymerase [Rice Peribunya-like virus 1]